MVEVWIVYEECMKTHIMLSSSDVSAIKMPSLRDGIFMGVI
jgi:hypothetical protein